MDQKPFPSNDGRSGPILSCCRPRAENTPSKDLEEGDRERKKKQVTKQNISNSITILCFQFLDASELRAVRGAGDSTWEHLQKVLWRTAGAYEDPSLKISQEPQVTGKSST